MRFWGLFEDVFIFFLVGFGAFFRCLFDVFLVCVVFLCGFDDFLMLLDGVKKCLYLAMPGGFFRCFERIF